MGVYVCTICVYHDPFIMVHFAYGQRQESSGWLWREMSSHRWLRRSPFGTPVQACMDKTLTTWGWLLGSLCERGGWSQPCSWQPIVYMMKTALQVALIDTQVGNLREFRSWMNIETELPSWPSQWPPKNRAEGKTHGQGSLGGFA